MRSRRKKNLIRFGTVSVRPTQLLLILLSSRGESRRNLLRNELWIGLLQYFIYIHTIKLPSYQYHGCINVWINFTYPKNLRDALRPFLWFLCKLYLYFDDHVTRFINRRRGCGSRHTVVIVSLVKRFWRHLGHYSRRKVQLDLVVTEHCIIEWRNLHVNDMFTHCS
jgi:hypothetical protein